MQCCVIEAFYFWLFKHASPVSHGNFVSYDFAKPGQAKAVFFSCLWSQPHLPGHELFLTAGSMTLSLILFPSLSWLQSYILWPVLHCRLTASFDDYLAVCLLREPRHADLCLAASHPHISLGICGVMGHPPVNQYALYTHPSAPGLLS